MREWYGLLANLNVIIFAQIRLFCCVVIISYLTLPYLRGGCTRHTSAEASVVIILLWQNLYRLDALPVAQPTVSEHNNSQNFTFESQCNLHNWKMRQLNETTERVHICCAVFCCYRVRCTWQNFSGSSLSWYCAICLFEIRLPHLLIQAPTVNTLITKQTWEILCFQSCIFYCKQQFTRITSRSYLNDFTLPYLTLPSGQVHKAHQRWGLNLGPMRNPDRPRGWRNLLEAFANLRRTVQWIPLRVSSESV